MNGCGYSKVIRTHFLYAHQMNGCRFEFAAQIQL